MAEDLWGAVKRQRVHRIAAWVNLAQQHLDLGGVPSLALPSELAAALKADTKALMTKAAHLPTEYGMADGFREEYRKAIGAIYQMSDECHSIWATSVLKQRPELVRQLEQLIIGVTSLVGTGKPGVITEGEIMSRLYVLDVGLGANSMRGGAHDWYQVCHAFQTRELWLSPAYNAALRGLVNSRRLIGGTQAGQLAIRQDRRLYNEALTELEILFGEDWADHFMAIASQLISDEVRIQEEPKSEPNILTQLGITMG